MVLVCALSRRVQFNFRFALAHCSNLTIYDTPGFRLGGKEALRREIQSMVEELMEPANRIIICLEQSTVEWANTSSRPIGMLAFGACLSIDY